MKREVTTETGFHCEIDEEALDDFELLEALANMDAQGDGVKIISGFNKSMELLLVVEQKAQLYEHIREQYGRVKMSALKTELLQIFTGLSEDKKK